MLVNELHLLKIELFYVRPNLTNWYFDTINVLFGIVVCYIDGSLEINLFIEYET